MLGWLMFVGTFTNCIFELLVLNALILLNATLFFSYGRTHVVDTVTEPPTSQNDETVTKESLDRQHKER